MNLKEWRAAQQKAAAEQAVELTRPSGLSILARRPDPAALLTWGRLPLGLASERAPEGADRSRSAEEVQSALDLTRQLLLYCLVKPRISFDPRGDDEIHPREIPMEDVVFLTRWAMRAQEADELRPFRTQRSAAESGGDGQSVRDAAVGAGGDPGSGAGAGTGPGGGRGSGPTGARVLFAG